MRRVTLRNRCVVLLTTVLLASAVRAQAPEEAEEVGLSAARPGGSQASSASKFPAITDIAGGYERKQGFITLWVNAKKQHILGEIPRSRLRSPFLLATSIVGGRYAGWQWDSLRVQWERQDRKLVLVEPEIRYRAGATLSEVVKRTYRDTVITALPIIAQGRSGSVVIDLTDLFSRRASLFVGFLAGGMDSSLAKIARAKAFDQNIEIEFDLFQPRRTMRNGNLGVHYSISQLPRTGYKPRGADDRIGYFLTAFKNFSKSTRDDTRFERFVNRWHIEKADAKLKLSEPREPIIFYIEKTVPIRYRRYVRAGILEWNKAFEKIGILGAIEVRQQTATRFADLDPEDVRYNFFRWITSEMPFAMGPSRVHPETGQILDADIVFDDSMIRIWLGEYDRLITQGPTREFHPAMQRYLRERPERHPLYRWRGREVAEAEAATPDLANRPELLLGASSPANCGSEGLPDGLAMSCHFGAGVRHQVSMGLLAQEWMAGAKSDEWPEQFVGQVLKEVVMHEVGHTLGLRHNFKGSSWLSLEEIRKKAPDEATSGSVMDYNPILVNEEFGPANHWVTQTLGPYDYWAIEYGYTLDQKSLPSIAKRVAEEGLAYGTDEDRYGSDPLVNVFDAGKDPLEYVKTRMKLVRSLLDGLVERIVKPGEGYQRARRAFDMLLYDYARTSWFATRFVGGHFTHRDHKGDPNERPPISPVDADKQREALHYICKTVFAKDVFEFPPELYQYLAVGRWRHWGSRDAFSSPEYPIHDRILQLQLWTLFDFMNPFTLSLVHDAEVRVAADTDALTIPEIFDTLTKAIFGEIKEKKSGKFTNRKPFVSSLRRNLQHEFVQDLIDLALEDNGGRSPQAARTQAWYRLRLLGEDLDTLLGGADLELDDYSAAHLIETRQRITKAIEASYSRDEKGGGGGFFLFGRPAENSQR